MWHSIIDFKSFSEVYINAMHARVVYLPLSPS